MEFIEDYPNIWNMLERPASIEPRALSLFVKDVYKGIFKEAWKSAKGTESHPCGRYKRNRIGLCLHAGDSFVRGQEDRNVYFAASDLHL